MARLLQRVRVESTVHLGPGIPHSTPARRRHRQGDHGHQRPAV